MRKLVRILLPSLAFLLLIPFAQSAEKKYRFELFGGAGYPIRQTFLIGTPQAVFPINGKHSFSWGGMGGARLGIDGRRFWGQDYSYSYGQNATRLATDFGSFSFTNRVHQASTSLLFYPWSLQRRVFFPYLTAGGGVTWVTVTQRTITQSSNPLEGGFGPLKSERVFTFHGGLGTRIRLSERFGLRLDARDYMSRALRYGLPKTSTDPTAAVLPVGGVFHQVAVTFGLVIHF